MSVSAGELDRRVTIQVATESRDSANDVILGWEDGFQLWASKRDQRGVEIVSSQQLIRQADTVFEIRRSARALAITPEKHRLVHDGKIFQIVGVQEGKTRKDSLQLLTSSRPDGQGSRGRDQVSGNP